jgi:hypothetical protein
LNFRASGQEVSALRNESRSTSRVILNDATGFRDRHEGSVAARVCRLRAP